MAVNAGGRRVGSLKARSQFQNPRTGLFTKRGPSGQFMAVKRSGGVFKGVAKEPDRRR